LNPVPNSLVRNKAMNAEPTPLVSKLTLLVLSGILVCLVLLVIRERPARAPSPANVEVAEAPATEEVPALPPASSRPAAVRPSPSAPKSVPRVASVRSEQTFPAPIAPGRTVRVTESALVAKEQNLVGIGVVPVAEPVAVPVPTALAPQLFGTVILIGTPPPEVPIDLGPSCGRLNPSRPTTRHCVVGPEGQLANVLVYVKVDSNPSFSPSAPAPLLDQVDCVFEPYVIAVIAGQPFRIRNSDPELHSVHATPRHNREFNFGQARQGQIDQKVFTKPELFIRLKCDVHPWMFAYVSVLDHPFFAVTDTNGFFALPAGIPPGRYRLNAVHLKAGEQAQDVELLPGEQKVVNLQFKMDRAARPQPRVARAEP
jgi:hypothetical protein